MKTSKVVYEFIGYSFTWDKNYKNCAYIFEPLREPGTKRKLELWINGKKIMNIPNGFDCNKIIWKKNECILKSKTSKNGIKVKINLK